MENPSWGFVGAMSAIFLQYRWRFLVGLELLKFTSPNGKIGFSSCSPFKYVELPIARHAFVYTLGNEAMLLDTGNRTLYVVCHNVQSGFTMSSFEQRNPAPRAFSHI